jgi:hypothetical protein
VAALMSYHGCRDAPPYADQTSFADLLRPSTRTRSHHRLASLHDAFANLLRPSTRTGNYHRPALLHDAFTNLLRPTARTRNYDRPAPNFRVRSGAAACACAATRTNRRCPYAAATTLD